GSSRRGVLHSDSCRAASARHTCNDLLVAAAHRGTNGAVGESRLLIGNMRRCPLLMLWTAPTLRHLGHQPKAGAAVVGVRVTWFQKDDQDHLLATSILVWPRPTAPKQDGDTTVRFITLVKSLKNSALGPTQKGLKEPIRGLGEEAAGVTVGQRDGF